MRIWLFLVLAVPFLACGASPEGIELAEDRREPGSAVLNEALESAGSAGRARAAQAMGRIQDPSYAEALARAAAEDRDETVRLAAIFALGQLGLARGAEVRRIPTEGLEQALAGENPKIAVAAVEALGKIAGAGAAQRLTPMLDHPSPEVRRATAFALFRLRFVPVWRDQAPDPPELPAATTARLIESLSDVAPGVREAAAYAFARYGEPTAVASLAALIQDDDEWTRMFAIRAIARSKGSEAASALAPALHDPSPRVRTEAVSALGAVGRHDLLPDLLLEDESFHVRSTLAAALAGADTPETLHLLERLEGDSSVSVRAAALDALSRRSGSAFADTVAERLGDEAWPIRLAAARAAGRLAATDSTLFDRVFAAKDARLRAAALAGVDDFGRIADVLASATVDPDLAIRGTAVAAAAGSPLASKRAMLAKSYDVSGGPEWIEVREAIVDGFASIGAESRLIEIYRQDPAPSVREKARVALVAEGMNLDTYHPVDPAQPPDSPYLGVAYGPETTIVLETDRGEIVIETLPEAAPIHVANFVKLVDDGFYDGLIWHRVVSDFVIQGGDPRGDGWGGPGYSLRDEINTEPFLRGTVGMPKSGKDTGGCQVFITHVPTPHLDGNYTVFGRVVSGMDVVDRIEVGDAIVRAYRR